MILHVRVVGLDFSDTEKILSSDCVRACKWTCHMQHLAELSETDQNHCALNSATGAGAGAGPDQGREGQVPPTG